MNTELVDTVLILAGLLALVVWGAVYVWRHAGESDYWITYQEQLEKDSRWHRCQNSDEGCVWEGLCHPGDCRRVDG